MTVSICHGSLFDSQASVLVNPVNCQGVAGAGLALEFKKRFPENNKAYVDWCRGEGVLSKARPGTALMVTTSTFSVINFATKDQWRFPSQLKWIKDGLQDMLRVIHVAYSKYRQDETQLLCTVAMPAVGCGLGGLSWDVVRALIEDVFATRSDVHVMLYEPQ